MRHFTAPAGLFLLLALYAALLSYQLSAPFLSSTNDWNSASFGMGAIRWWTDGPGTHRWGQFLTLTDAPEAATTHPQWLLLPLWLSYLGGGIGEWQTRIVPLVFSLGSLALFWRLVDFTFQDRRLTFITGLFYVLLPIGIYFGRMMSHEALTRFFLLAAVLMFFLIERSGKPWRLFILGLIIGGGGLVDWPMFYLVPVLIWYAWVKKDFPLRRWTILTIGGAAILVLAANLLHFWILTGPAFLTYIAGAAARHVGTATFGSVLNLAVSKVYHEVINFTVIGLLLAGGGLIVCYRLPPDQRRRFSLLALLLVFPALVHYLLFWGGQSHEFWSFYFTPVVALLMGWGWLYLPWPRLKLPATAYFILISLWQTYMILFSRADFQREDTAFLKAAFADKNDPSPVCVVYTGDPSSDFYFLKLHKERTLPVIEVPPCSRAQRYWLRRWDQVMRRTDWRRYGIFEKNFSHALRTISLEPSLLLQSLKLFPYFTEQWRSRFSRREIIYQNLTANQTQNETLVAADRLQLNSCSPNFCLYRR